MTLSDKDREICATTGVPEHVVLLAKQLGQNLRRLQGIDDDGNEVKVPGITIDVDQDEALSTASELQEAAGPGYLAFVSDRNYGFDNAPDHVSVMKVSEQFDALRTMGTNGLNYDISPEKIIERLKKWDAAYGLILQGVAFDWVEARFEQQPSDMLAFAKEVYEFCPDVVDQGTGTVEALAGEMKQTNSVYLWWD